MISFYLDIYPKVGLLDHLVVPFLIYWVTSILFLIVDVSVYIPTNSIKAFHFLCILTSIYLLSFFYNSPPNRGEVVIYISLMTSDFEHLYMYLLAMYKFPLENIDSSHLLIFQLGYWFVAIELYEFPQPLLEASCDDTVVPMPAQYSHLFIQEKGIYPREIKI